MEILALAGVSFFTMFIVGVLLLILSIFLTLNAAGAIALMLATGIVTFIAVGILAGSN